MAWPRTWPCRSSRSTAPPPVVLRSQLVALLLVLPLGLWQLQESTWSWESALAMVPLGALGTGLAIVLMATLAGRVGAPRASIAIYFLPLVAVVLGVVVLGESVAPWPSLGVALVLVGAWIASRREALTRAPTTGACASRAGAAAPPASWRSASAVNRSTGPSTVYRS